MVVFVSNGRTITKVMGVYKKIVQGQVTKKKKALSKKNLQAENYPSPPLTFTNGPPLKVARLDIRLVPDIRQRVFVY